MCSRLDDIYVGAKIGTTSQVLRYGSYFPGMPTAFTPDFIQENDILGISTYGNNLAILANDLDNNYKLRIYDLKNYSATKYTTSGVITSNWVDFGTRRTKKSIDEILIALDPYNVSEVSAGTITIRARKTKNDSYTTIATISSVS